MTKKETTKFVVQIIISIASAILTALNPRSSFEWMVGDSSFQKRHSQSLFPYFVAIISPCHNNSDNNIANFLESAQDHRTFASKLII